jgi:hypothetical protein
MSAVFLTVSKTRGPKRADKTRNGRAAAPFSISRRPCANSKPPVPRLGRFFLTKADLHRRAMLIPVTTAPRAQLDAAWSRCIKRVKRPHAAQPEHRRTRLRYVCIFRVSLHAKVSRKASAKSGERSPRFFMSALLSTTILPVEVKLYVSGPDGRGLFLWLRCLRSFT